LFKTEKRREKMTIPLLKRDILSKEAIIKNKRIKTLKELGGHWIVELIYYKDSGGMINVWEPGRSDLEHIWTTSDNGKYHKLNEHHFSNNKNARWTFSKITSWKKAVDIENTWNN